MLQLDNLTSNLICFKTYILGMMVLGEIFECGKAMSNGHCRHPGMDRYGNHIAPHVREPLSTCVHILSKESSYRLCGIDNMISHDSHNDNHMITLGTGGRVTHDPS